MKKTLLTIATAVTLSGCAFLQSLKPTPKPTFNDKRIERISKLLYKAVDERMAKLDSTETINLEDTNYVRKIKIDLNESKKLGTHEKNQPIMYQILGLEGFMYIDRGKKGYSKEDTLVTSLACRHQKYKKIAHVYLVGSRNYQSRPPEMDPNTLEIRVQVGRKQYYIQNTETKKYIPLGPEYERFMNQSEKFLENKVLKTDTLETKTE